MLPQQLRDEIGDAISGALVAGSDNEAAASLEPPVMRATARVAEAVGAVLLRWVEFDPPVEGTDEMVEQARVKERRRIADALRAEEAQFIEGGRLLPRFPGAAEFVEAAQQDGGR
jgi:hypothetical protein